MFFRVHPKMFFLNNDLGFSVAPLSPVLSAALTGCNMVEKLKQQVHFPTEKKDVGGFLLSVFVDLNLVLGQNLTCVVTLVEELPLMA